MESLPSPTGPEDIYDGNLKLILGLIWTLICKYQIKSSGRGLSTRKALLGWINTVVPEYNITNFNTNWNDGRAICGMVDRIRPGTCPNHFGLDPRRGLENCQLGMDLAEQHLDIPKVLSPEDLHDPNVDDLSVMTYCSYFCDPFNQLVLQWIRKKIPNRNIKNLSTDWNNGINLGALAEACFPGICPNWDKMKPENAIENLERMIKLNKDRLGLECPVSAAELAEPKVDEIIVATYLSQFRNAKMRATPEEFSLLAPNLPNGSAIVGKPVTFEIEAAGQAATLASEIKVKAHGPSSDIEVKVSPARQGLDATFVPTEGGDYEVFAIYNDDHIQGSPFSLKVADPSKCQILGDLPTDLQVGEPSDFIVKTRGAGFGKLTCSADTPSEAIISSEIEDKDNDTQEVTLQPKAIGEAQIEVKWAGENIPQSPFKVNICDAKECSVEGDALVSGIGKVGEKVQFTIKANNAGSGRPLVKARGPTAEYSLDIVDKGNGKYNASFTPWEVGPHKIDVLFGGGHVPNSPFSMNIAAAPDANNCSATGTGLKRAVAGKPTEFTIIAPEKGLLEKEQQLEVMISSPKEKAKVEIDDKNDGTYKVTYTAPTPGEWKATVKYFDKQIPGSPFKLEVVPAADASRCKAYGPALHPNSLHISGTPLDLFVDTKQAGKGELQVIVKGPDDIRPKIYMAKDDGVHSLKFDVPEPGRYYVHIWWSQVYIPGSPFKIRVHPGPNPGMVKAYGRGLESDVETGQPAEFVIETKNAGIGTVTIRVHGIKDGFKIEANPASESDPRTLHAHYDPKEPGDYIVSIRWSGDLVPQIDGKKGKPFKVRISDPPQEEKPKTKQSSKVSLVLPDDVDAPESPTDNGVPVMDPEQARRYQQHLLRRQRLAQAGMESYPVHPHHANPAYAQSGGMKGMQRKLKVNPSMTDGSFATSVSQSSTKKTVVEEETVAYLADDESSKKHKKKRKHKF